MYHAPERTLNIKKSKKSGRRGGVHQQPLPHPSQARTLMLGGYAPVQLLLHYWGPTGVNRDCHVVFRKLGG